MKTDSDPNGWRIAGLTIALAAALAAGAYTIHIKTFCDPRHPACEKIGPATNSHATQANPAH
jgi:hypothetical protein